MRRRNAVALGLDEPALTEYTPGDGLDAFLEDVVKAAPPVSIG